MARAPLARRRRRHVAAARDAADAASTRSTSPPPTCPRHVAIIMDGNRRWAREAGLTEAEGHAAGVEAIRPLIRHAVRRGIRGPLALRVQQRELVALARRGRACCSACSRSAIRDETPELREQGVRIRLLGRLEELPDGDPRVDRGRARRDRRRRAADAQRRLQLLRPARDRRCGPALRHRRADRRRRSTRTPSTRACTRSGCRRSTC